jgi:hypothetical protein
LTDLLFFDNLPFLKPFLRLGPPHPGREKPSFTGFYQFSVIYAPSLGQRAVKGLGDAQ